MADAISIQELIDARTDAKTLEEAVNGDAVTTVLSRLGETYPTLSNALNQIDSKLDSADSQIKQGITNLFENGGLPATPFKTKALMTASALVDGKYAMVTDDTVNNGLYVKTAGAWVKSGYDPLTQAKSYTDTSKTSAISTAALDATAKANAAEVEAVSTSNNYTDKEIDAAEKTLLDADKKALQSNNYKYIADSVSPIIPILTDWSATEVLLGVEASSGNITGKGLVGNYNKVSVVNGIQAYQGMRETNNDDLGVYPIVTDVTERKIVLGVDSNTGEVVGNFKKPTTNMQDIKEKYNMVIFAGQSLAEGGEPSALSKTNKYPTAMMFNTGIRSEKGASSLIPLVEGYAPDSDGGARERESPTSGFANYVLSRSESHYGLDVSQHKLLMSNLGKGGTPIEWHIKGGNVYNNFYLPLIKTAVGINNNTAVRAICWLHGENSQSFDMPKQQYYNHLLSIIRDLNNDYSTYEGQLNPVRLITYQTTAVTSNFATAGVSLAQLQLVKDGLADLASPVYRFQRVSTDTVHLSNISSKLMGAYFARAYCQRVFENRQADYLEPLNATIVNDTVVVAFNVPTLPLRFEVTELPVVTDKGFAVYEDGVKIAVTGVTIEGSSVVIKLAATPTGLIKVRYALDYSSTVYNNYTSSGVGNLADSTPEIITIAGLNYTMYHVAPHFEITAPTLNI